MNREELKQIIRGVSVAVPTPFDKDYRLDLAAATDLTQWWVSQGLGASTSMIKLCSAWGQGPDISDDEWPHLVRTVVNAGGPGVNVMCGLKSKDTMRTIEDAKIAQDMGANSLQIELPYNHAPNQDQYVKHFTMISDAIDIGIMIYNTYWFGVARQSSLRRCTASRTQSTWRRSSGTTRIRTATTRCGSSRTPST